LHFLVLELVEGDREKKPLLTGKYIEANPQFSPDGKWMAYFSQESGQREVYVRPYPDVNKGGRWQISRGGGQEPKWSPDGGELFYWSGDAIMAVKIEQGPTFRPGPSKELFRGRYFTEIGFMYDISPDGKRFLMIKEAGSIASEAKNTDQINIVLNWFEELKHRVPVK